MGFWKRVLAMPEWVISLTIKRPDGKRHAASMAADLDADWNKYKDLRAILQHWSDEIDADESDS